MDTATKTSVALAEYTSFKVGGKAEYFIEAKNSSDLENILKATKHYPIWILGYGSNVLISDEGLPGLTIVNRGGNMDVLDDTVVVDAGVWWDDVVASAVEHSLWGIELLSYIPGSVGASLFINIAAYGQSISQVVDWIEYWDPKKHEAVKISSQELSWGYKQSYFANNAQEGYVILRAGLKLSKSPTTELTYQKALDVATERNLSGNVLADRRIIIREARERAGSLWDYRDKQALNTAGSFFKNPLVAADQAEKIISFDESGKTAEQIKRMNEVHGGDAKRVSAAHVMLASGFKRAQQWGNVKLNEQNLLKLETLPGATASELFAVITRIQQTCRDVSGVQLEPEVQILGAFDNQTS